MCSEIILSVGSARECANSAIRAAVSQPVRAMKKVVPHGTRPHRLSLWTVVVTAAMPSLKPRQVYTTDDSLTAALLCDVLQDWCETPRAIGRDKEDWCHVDILPDLASARPTAFNVSRATRTIACSVKRWPHACALTRNSRYGRASCGQACDVTSLTWLRNSKQVDC